MSEHPVVTLADKSYSVPPLVPRQLRVVMPAIVRIDSILPKSRGGEGAPLTTAIYDDMISVIFWGAVWPNDKKADAGTTISTLMDSAISVEQMYHAMSVIRTQTGLFKAAPKEGAPPGSSDPSGIEWDRVVAEFSYRLSQTWDYIDTNLTVAQIFSYRDFWKISPPVDLLVAGYLGYEAKSAVSNDNQIEQAAQFFGGLPQ